MDVKVNGTDAKDIGLYFLNAIGKKPDMISTPQAVNAAKRLLADGLTKEEVISVIDHVINDWKIKPYSFGYIIRVAEDALLQIKEKEGRGEALKKLEAVRAESAATIAGYREGFETDEQSAERNRRKARGFNTQSRFREKFNFDMFEE